MIETMPICFCYKAINSFYTIFHEENHYDLIKELVLNIKSPSTDLERKIKEYQNAILLIFNCKVLTKTEFTRIAKYIDNNEPASFETISNILTAEDIFESCNQMLNADVSTNDTQLFLSYAVILKRLNEFFKTYFLIPSTLREETKSINDDTVRKFFIKGWFKHIAHRQEKTHTDLFAKISDNHNNAKIAPEIHHLYMFGSIPNRTYHKESDIDMVVEFVKNTTLERRKTVLNDIKSYNKSTFNRKTDIYDLEDFMEYNPKLKLTQIF